MPAEDIFTRVVVVWVGGTGGGWPLSIVQDSQKIQMEPFTGQNDE
jgi:hypothetical protein